MAYAPPPGYMPIPADPTNVIGRRIGAFFIDAVPGWVVFGAVWIATLHTTTSFGYSAVCDGGAGGDCLHTTRQGNTGAAFLLFLLVAIANHVVLQGVTGATVGKHLTGLRVIRADGQLCGLGRALGRSAMILVDGLFCYLVGLITMLATRPHRRVGDFVAGTYVVASTSVGRPIPGAAPLVPYAYGVYAPPGQGAPPAPYGPPPGATAAWTATQAPPATPQWGAPPPPPQSAAPPSPAPSWGAPPAAAPRATPPGPAGTPPAPASWGSPPTSASPPPPPPGPPADQGTSWWDNAPGAPDVPPGPTTEGSPDEPSA